MSRKCPQIRTEMTRNEKLTRYILGDLSPEEERQFVAMMASDSSLRAEVSVARSLSVISKDVVAQEADRRLDPFFADRLMKVLSGNAAKQSYQEEFVDALVRWFSPVSVVSLAIIFLLVAGSLVGSQRTQSVAESVFGLPAVTVANVYDIDFE